MAGTATRELPDTASGVLAFARARRAAADRAEADLLQAAVQWAVLHPAESVDDAESFRLRSGGETAVGLAGPGAPLVAEFSVAEFAAAVGLGTEAGKYYLGQALELRYRLPRLWKAVSSDGRHFDRDHDQVSFAGTSMVHGELDLADAIDLDDAIRTLAAHLGDLGCEESLDVRRSLAAGELARRQLALDLTTDPVGEGAGARRRPVRKTVMHLHLSQAALEGTDHVGRLENTRSPVTADQIRDWCGHPATHLIVKPVIDLEDHVHVDAYEVPDRTAEALALRDHSCVSLVHPPRPHPEARRPWLRLRPRGPVARTTPHLHLLPGTVVPTPPPPQDPLGVELHHPRPRHLPLVQPPRLPVPPRPHRHPRRQPRPPTARTAPRMTPPHTPPTPAGPSA